MYSIARHEGLIILMILVPLFFGVPNTIRAQDDQGVDGVCKDKGSIPAGLVPVTEFNSPECESKNPFDRNAWGLAKAVDGIVSCKAIDYDKDDPPTINLMVCGRILTEKCSPNRDGTPNGYILKKPSTCEVNTRSVNSCAKRADNEFVVAGDDDCFFDHGGTVTVRRLDVGEFLPVCNNQLRHADLYFYPVRFHDKHLIRIVRRFHDPSCGGLDKLNAEVLTRDLIAGADILFACELHFAFEPKLFPKIREATRRHDDRCGIGSDTNSFRFSLR